MAKDKSKSGMKNKHLHARVSFLHRAATYLTDQNHASQPKGQKMADRGQAGAQLEESGDALETGKNNESPPAQRNIMPFQRPSSGGLPLHVSSHMSQVARKSQIRLAPDVKHSICKRCATIQVEGNTCKKFTENLSKGGKKPHADVLVQECTVCGAKKQWPVGAKRQRKRGERNGSVATKS